MDITEKIWWIALDGKSEGPYSYLDLERDERFKPDTLVWQEGWKEWKKAKELDELKQLFKKEEPIEENLGHEGVEDMVDKNRRTIPPWIFFWIIAIILCIAYLWQLFRT